jgi:repressor LexA
MIDVGIHDGDLLAVHQTQQVTNGQIVVARIGDEVTVKRFKKGSDSHIVELIAENPDFAPIIVDLTQEFFAIEGLSVGVVRRN